MVHFSLQICFGGENVKTLQIEGHEIYQWMVHLKCTKCHEVTQKEVSFCESEYLKIPGGKGQANLVMKCWNCKCHMSISVLKKSKLICNAYNNWTELA